MIPAAVGAAAASGALSFFGGERTNRANARQAKEQMAFQERMANTSWQRGVADMKAAGLNPGLAYEKGGADAPSGTMATMEDSVSKGVSSAQDARTLQSRLETEAAQRQNIAAQTNLTNEQTRSTALKRKAELALLLEQVRSTAGAGEHSYASATRIYNLLGPEVANLNADLDLKDDELNFSRPAARKLIRAQLAQTGASAREIEQRIRLTERMTPSELSAFIQRDILPVAEGITGIVQNLTPRRVPVRVDTKREIRDAIGPAKRR